MAHIVVYLQRTPQGLHPGSAVALCWARDIASERGASVTAVGLGDAGDSDDALARMAGRFGADALVLGGEEVLERVVERLHPVHVLVPWTSEGLASAATLTTGPACPRWIRDAKPPFAGADAISAILAGVYPWYDLPTEIEPEYERESANVTLPAWTSERRTGPYVIAPSPPLGVLSARPLDADGAVRVHLEQLELPTVTNLELTDGTVGTLVWLGDDGHAISAALVHRPAAVRLILLPGITSVLDRSWLGADWAFAGSPTEILRRWVEDEAPWNATSGVT